MAEFGTLQAWLLIGVPALVVTVGLYLMRSPVAGMVAFFLLAAGFGGMALIDRASAGVFGVLLALLYAAGRSGSRERGDGQPDWRRVEAAEDHAA